MRAMSKEEHRKVLLDLASEIHRICDEHGLVYVIQGGTLLGAIRHGGFIPWDDDFDIMMPRYDYDMLVENFDRWTSSPEYTMLAPALKNTFRHFAKVAHTKTLVKETYIDDEYCTGAWIDILPLDCKADNTDELIKKVAWSKMICYAVVTGKHSASSRWIRAAKVVAQPFARLLFNPSEIAYRTDQLIRRQSAHPTDTLISYMGTHSFIHECPIDQVFSRKLVPFEDRSFWAPANYDGALTIEFGPDWKTPIEEESHSQDESRFFL